MQSLDSAIAAQRELLRQNPKHLGALNLIGAMLLQSGQFDEAARYLGQALQLNARSDATLNNYALALKALRRPLEAVRHFDQALAINPGAADTWASRGAALTDLARHADALASFDRALALAPNYADAWFNKGNSHFRLNQIVEAIAAYERAMALRPDIAQVQHALAEAVAARGYAAVWALNFEAAQKDFDRAVTLLPALRPAIEANRFFAKLNVCDWEHFEMAAKASAVGIVQANNLVGFTPCLPHATAELQHQIAANFVRQYRPAMPALWNSEVYRHDRIRVGYVSADFREHAVARLMAELIEQHDRTRFEIIALSLGSDDGSPLRRRLAQSFDQFNDVHGQSDIEIAQAIKDSEIDIAVDMNGHTNGSPIGMFAFKPAPVAASYLGYPGTTGAPYFDYLIADRIVAPAEHQPFFSERLVHLPDCYQVNDRLRPIAERTPSRAEAELPETGIVFCGFNRSIKITPATFAVWMRLLRRVEGSVLWLMRDSDIAERNLRHQAFQHGIDPARLVFAGRILPADHLARHRLADLFLDTLPYNAHTTASDALWAGVPVITCIGETFAGRVGASIVSAAGLPELICPNLEAYESMAFGLASSPQRIAALKAKIQRNRETCALFDTARFTRNLETAYVTMMETHRRGDQPRAFAVEPTA